MGYRKRCLMMFAWVVMCCYYATDFQEQKGFVRFLLLPPISVVWFVRLPSRNNSRLLLMRVEFGLRDAGERESEKSGQRSTQRKSRAILFTKGILSENLSQVTNDSGGIEKMNTETYERARAKKLLY